MARAGLPGWPVGRCHPVADRAAERVFLRGFGEAIGIAVGVVAVYLALNLLVMAAALLQVLGNPHVVADWRNLLVTKYASPLTMVGVALIVFPKLALGLGL